MRTTACWVAFFVVLLLGATEASAQFDRGGRSRGRGYERSSSADESSSRRGGNGGGARTESFLRRIDANGNGQIDADEVPGPQKEMIEGMLRRLGVELKYPIALGSAIRAAASSERAGGGAERNGDAAPPLAGFGMEKPPAAPPADASHGANGGGSNGAGPDNAERLEDFKPLDAAGPPADSVKPAAAPATTASDPAPSRATSSTPDASTSASKAAGRKSGRFLTPRERLDKRLPAWFLEKDRDGDGQVMMWEYARSWTLDTAAEFERYDLNRDGIVTAAECLKKQK